MKGRAAVLSNTRSNLVGGARFHGCVVDDVVWDPFRQQEVILISGPILPPCAPGQIPWTFDDEEQLTAYIQGRLRDAPLPVSAQ